MVQRLGKFIVAQSTFLIAEVLYLSWAIIADQLLYLIAVHASSRHLLSLNAIAEIYSRPHWLIIEVQSVSILMNLHSPCLRDLRPCCHRRSSSHLLSLLHPVVIGCLKLGDPSFKHLFVPHQLCHFVVGVFTSEIFQNGQSFTKVLIFIL